MVTVYTLLLSIKMSTSHTISYLLASNHIGSYVICKPCLVH
ncbi:hypothetical protein MtrunA17_Chr3g0120611 [Medicago truncatula]|uniref:Uncharacterized protein n=1 Tax=Medicago truncatula TaxID=3880 RepID=A0A396IYA5_MEDTR|nr:hypothetical protein MtrunA17_Chr3g0120611 [Medicago truncatula]